MKLSQIVKVAAQQPRPPKAMLEKAVKAAQLYMGSQGATRASDQQKLYKRMMDAIAKLEKWGSKHGLGTDLISQQISDEAQRRGKITPQPGKDI